MKKYYIVNDEGAVWSRAPGIGYWSKLNDVGAIHNRAKFIYPIAKLLLWDMKSSGVIAKIVSVADYNDKATGGKEDE